MLYWIGPFANGISQCWVTLVGDSAIADQVSSPGPFAPCLPSQLRAEVEWVGLGDPKWSPRLAEVSRWTTTRSPSSGPSAMKQSVVKNEMEQLVCKGCKMYSHTYQGARGPREHTSHAAPGVQYKFTTPKRCTNIASLEWVRGVDGNEIQEK